MLGRNTTSRIASSSSQNGAGSTAGGEGGSKRGLLGKAKAGIAHTSILPALGPSSLRPLSNLLIAEKSILAATSTLAGDTSKAATALSAWAQGEGDDLDDVLSKCAELLSLLGDAESCWSTRAAAGRVEYKDIRTMEEALSSLRSRRSNVGSKADAAEKKLVKMTAENKNLPAQTELLMGLRGEMRELDTEIVQTEASLSTLKRHASLRALHLKFSSLLEFSEKATIIGELGKLVLASIPTVTSTPGLPRPAYPDTERQRTDGLVVEAKRCLSEVKFETAPEIAHKTMSDLNAGASGLGVGPNTLQRNGSAVSGIESFAHYADFGDDPELPLAVGGGVRHIGREDEETPSFLPGTTPAQTTAFSYNTPEVRGVSGEVDADEEETEGQRRERLQHEENLRTALGGPPRLPELSLSSDDSKQEESTGSGKAAKRLSLGLSRLSMGFGNRSTSQGFIPPPAITVPPPTSEETIPEVDSPAVVGGLQAPAAESNAWRGSVVSLGEEPETYLSYAAASPTETTTPIVAAHAPVVPVTQAAMTDSVVKGPNWNQDALASHSAAAAASVSNTGPITPSTPAGDKYRHSNGDKEFTYTYAPPTSQSQYDNNLPLHLSNSDSNSPATDSAVSPLRPSPRTTSLTSPLAPIATDTSDIVATEHHQPPSPLHAINTDENSLALSAAQREVEREMDNLAFVSSSGVTPSQHRRQQFESPMTSPVTQAKQLPPTSPTAGHSMIPRPVKKDSNQNLRGVVPPLPTIQAPSTHSVNHHQKEEDGGYEASYTSPTAAAIISSTSDDGSHNSSGTAGTTGGRGSPGGQPLPRTYSDDSAHSTGPKRINAGAFGKRKPSGLAGGMGGSGVRVRGTSPDADDEDLRSPISGGGLSGGLSTTTAPLRPRRAVTPTVEDEFVVPETPGPPAYQN